MKIKPYYIAPVAVFAVIVAALYIGLGLNPRETAFPLYGKPPPEFALPALFEDEDGLQTADLLHGEVTILNFWASWCAPCRVEHPLLLSLARDQNLHLQGIAFKDEPDDARAYLRTHGIPFRKIGNDHQGRAAIEWGVAGVPETFIINKAGEVVYRWQGPITEPVLRGAIGPLLEKLKAE